MPTPSFCSDSIGIERSLESPKISRGSVWTGAYTCVCVAKMDEQCGTYCDNTQAHDHYPQRPFVGRHKEAPNVVRAALACMQDATRCVPKVGHGSRQLGTVDTAPVLPHLLPLQRRAVRNSGALATSGRVRIP